MHESTTDRLESLLRQGSPQPRDGHVQQCPECSSELNTMREQAEWVRHLRPAEEFEPAAGFYARVLQRIEEHAKRSIWYGLVYSPVGKRLAYGSLSLALVLGLYVIAAEQMDRPESSKPVIAEQAHPQVFGDSGAAEQRDAVLVNFASYGSDAAVPAQP